MADYLTTDTELTSIANAIRTKGGTSALLTFPNEFVSAINAITTQGTYQSKYVSPTESQQVVTPSSGYDALSSVTVEAISSNYVGSNIPQNDSSDLTVNGSQVIVPSGYYAAVASKAISAGSATTPDTTISITPSISVDSSGLITVSASDSKSVTPTVNAGYISAGTAGIVTVSGSNTSQLSTQAAAVITPTESAQTAVASGKYTTGDVTVAAISSTYIGSGVATQSATTYTPSSATQTIPSGVYLTGVQTISGDVNLVAENIASGVTIFGIEGTHTSGTDTSDATLSSGNQMLNGYTAYASGVKYTGTIITRSDSSNITLNASTTSKSYAAGYYPNAHGAKVTVYDGSVS